MSQSVRKKGEEERGGEKRKKRMEREVENGTSFFLWMGN
jgi:hypothetical protein